MGIPDRAFTEAASHFITLPLLLVYSLPPPVKDRLNFLIINEEFAAMK